MPTQGSVGAGVPTTTRCSKHKDVEEGRACHALKCPQLLPCHAVPDQVMGTVYKYIIFHGLLYALPLYQSEQDTKHARDYLLCSRKPHSEIKLLA